MVEKTEIGRVEHYFDKIGVAVVKLSGSIHIGDTLAIEGPNTSVTQKVVSMQVEHKSVDAAEAGQAIGMKVDQQVKEGDKVYKVSE